MTQPHLFCLVLFGGLLLAQAPPESMATGSISGAVLDAAGKAVADADVGVSGGPTRKSGVTDAEGKYTLNGLAAGLYRVTATMSSPTARGFGPRAAKNVNVGAGLEVKGLDLMVRAHAEISGKVVDSNKEPIPGVSVLKVAREYALGSLRYVLAGATTTDDLGEYTLGRFEPGQAYLLLVRRAPHPVDAVSQSPVNPKLRRPAFMPTFYPNVTQMEGAQPMVLQPGEKREGIDFQVARSQSYCIDGATGPGAFRFWIEQQKPHSGRSGNGGFYMGSPGGMTGPDGKFRICDLSPGDYRLTVYSETGGFPEHWGIAQVTITERDIERLIVPAVPRVPVSGEAVWDGAAPDPPIPATLNISVDPMTRAGFSGERSLAKATIPGVFSFEQGLLMDEYRVEIRELPTGTYLKEVVYGNRNLLREPFRPGTAQGEATIKVVVARDGGTVRATVQEKDGKPVADSNVVLLPPAAANDGAVAAAMVTGQTDQNGAWRSGQLAPGKYLALAVRTEVTPTPEVVSKLWNARSRAEEVEIGRAASVQLTLHPVSLD